MFKITIYCMVAVKTYKWIHRYYSLYKNIYTGQNLKHTGKKDKISLILHYVRTSHV